MKLLLLTSNSRESKNKASQLSKAGIALEMSPVVSEEWLPGFDLEIPCSDSKIMCTQWGRDLGWLGSKLETAEKLNQLGLPSLPTYEITSMESLDSILIDGPIFVKSDRSSGTSSPHSFGYCQFASVKHFKQHLASLFPNAIDGDNYREVFGNYVIQPFIPHDGLFTVSFIAGQKLATAFVKTDSSCFYEYMHFSKQYDWHGAKSLSVLSDGIPFLYIQCLHHDGKYIPIDINIRLSTYLDTLMTHLDTSFYVKCLSAISEDIEQTWNIPEALIGRVKTDWRRETFSVADSSLARLLNFGVNPPAAGKFDAAYSYPTYIIKGDNVVNQRRLFLESVKIK